MVKGTTLHNYIIAVSGDMGKDNSLENIKRWVECAGGKYSAKVEDGISHLVCSKENWERDVTAVQKAKKIKKCKIVTWDWLEDCFQQHRRIKVEGEYLCRAQYKMAAKEKAERKKRERKGLKKDVQRFNAGSEAAKTDLHSGKPTMASRFLSYVDREEADLKEGKKKDRPAIQPYTLWDNKNKSAESGEIEDEKMHNADDEDDESDSSTTATSTRKRDDDTPTSPSRLVYSSPIGSSVEKSEFSSLSKKSTKSNADASSSSKGNRRGAPKVQPKQSTTTSKSTPTINSITATLLIPAPTPLKPLQRSHSTDPTPDIENHHLYRDFTGFVYSITLARLIISANGNERYYLKLYESHTTPCTYAIHLRYAYTNLLSRPSAVTGSERGEIVCPVGSSFQQAFEAWKRIFREKTCQEWERRETRVVGIVEGGRQFNYKVPRMGEPTGLRAPVGYVLPPPPLPPSAEELKQVDVVYASAGGPASVEKGDKARNFGSGKRG